MQLADAERLADIRTSLKKFEEQIATLTDDAAGRRNCRTAARELMILLQALVNRLRE